MLIRPPRFVLIAAIALLIATGCSSGDDSESQAFVNSDRSPETVDELLGQTGEGSEGAALQQANDSLAEGPTPIGPNTRAILAGPPFEGLSSVATGCVLSRQADDQRLLDLFTAAVSEQRLILSDVVDLRSAVVTCAPDELAGYFATMASERASTITPEGAVPCISTALSTSAEHTFLSGVTAIDLDQTVPADAIEITIAHLAGCFDGTSVAPAIKAQIAAQPVLANAADAACVDATLQEPGASAGFWSQLVRTSGVEPGAVPAEVAALAFTPIERCLSNGRIIAGITAGYGIALSATTVGCLDQAVPDRTLVTRTIGGDEPDPAEFMSLLTECATGDELTALNQ